MPKVLNTIQGYEKLKLFQRTDMFNYSIESILLPEFLDLKKNNSNLNIIDIGTNNGVIPLILSEKTKAKITGIEIQQEASELAKENILINNLEKQIQIKNISIQEFSKLNQKFDIVICNPPFFKVHDLRRVTKKSEFIKNARHEFLLTLETLIINVRKIIENKGSFYLAHKTERLNEVLELLNIYNFTPKKISFIHSKVKKESQSFLVKSIFQGPPGLEVTAPLIVIADEE
ncbi:tRNA1(Val) (adenine(37)-N6)-methyltransferase [Spiroplasma endosymbiont of Amphibalanus improvisus]|uniref:tRNA1(Val) (adenine(37)-N6)-methyltransferase n=1 Tax=Spiroplasma endosymbiont of Amphibalanus improvisus TaxID=3066327 RepID=UPI00313D45CF